ncbi:MAG: tRNA-dihydrouridine synthase family protein, partial [Bdellovibrionales bacterium]|nr:tRNA-dihydrouridine synthase family protein [Bdellovibrionales bacterium]
QIFGYDILRMVEAARMVEDAGADIVDINCGCPVPKVVKRGGGCELMRQPTHLARILSAVRQAITIPLTLKIRAGWDDNSRNAIEIAKLAEDSGIAMLAIHGRTRRALYRGDADWDLVASVVDAVSIPVVGSGDVVDGESAKERRSSGVAGLMIGRAALENPWVFSQIQAEQAGRILQPPTPLDVVQVLEEYRELLLEELPERAVIGRLKQFASHVTKLIPRSKEWRRALCTSSGLTEFDQVIELMNETFSRGQKVPQSAAA